MMKRVVMVSVLLCAAVAFAQGAVQDPLEASSAMADKIRSQIAELRTFTLRALVVGAENKGVAVLQCGKDVNDLKVVRAGDHLIQQIGGLSVKLSIEGVTADGVALAAPTLSEKLLIPGSFRGGAAPQPADALTLRHLECSQISLEQLLRLIADQTGANLSASAMAAKEQISGFYRNVTASTALAEICRSRGLWYQHDEASGVTRVTTMREYEDSLVSFREEVTESFTLLYPNVIEVAATIYGIYPERVLLSLGDEELLEDDLNDLSRRFERFNAISDTQSTLLETQPGRLNASAGRGSGGRFSSAESGVSRLRSTQSQLVDARSQAYRGLTTSDAAKLQEAQAKGDAKVAETILETRVAKQANIFITLSRKNNMIVVRTSDPKVMNEIRSLIRRLDVPTPMVLLEMKVLELTLEDGATSSFHMMFGDNYSILGHDTGFGVGYQGYTKPSSSDLSGLNDTSHSMTFGIMNDTINARLQALVSEKRVHVLSTPTLLVANNEVSRIFSGERRPIVTDISSQTVVNDSTSTTAQNTSFEWRDVGTMILVTPNINSDGTVSIRMVHEVANVKPGDGKIPLATNLGTTEYATVDVIESRSISGTFVANDAQSVMIGGLISDRDEETEYRVPYLGRIPLLGFLFRSRELAHRRSELVVLVTPHVISTPADGERISKRVSERISQNPVLNPNATTNTTFKANLFSSRLHEK